MSDLVYLIRKQGAWYRPNSAGYTGSAIQAGRYTREDAIDITHPNGPDGPRDGMSYIHEDDVICGDLAAYTEQAAEIERLRRECAASVYLVSVVSDVHKRMIDREEAGVFEFSWADVDAAASALDKFRKAAG